MWSDINQCKNKLYDSGLNHKDYSNSFELREKLCLNQERISKEFDNLEWDKKIILNWEEEIVPIREAVFKFYKEKHGIILEKWMNLKNMVTYINWEKVSLTFPETYFLINKAEKMRTTIEDWLFYDKNGYIVTKNPNSEEKIYGLTNCMAHSINHVIELPTELFLEDKPFQIILNNLFKKIYSSTDIEKFNINSFHDLKHWDTIVFKNWNNNIHAFKVFVNDNKVLANTDNWMSYEIVTIVENVLKTYKWEFDKIEIYRKK